MYGENKKTNPAIIREKNTLGRGDHDCKCPKTGSLFAHWGENNDNSMAGGKGASVMVKG